MSLRINLNSASLTAHRMLTGTDNSLSKSIERLSSGYKINGAGDDPAGLVISEKLRAQIGGLSQAVKNAGDAVNMVKTAEGALNEVHRLLRSMRDLAVHAANTGANDAASIAADQAQIVNARNSIDKIAAETQFGTKYLLNGSSGIKVTVTGSSVTGANLSYATTLAATDTISITTTQAAEKATLNSKDFGDDDAEVVGAAGTFYINGVGVTYEANTTVAQLATLVNAVSDQTGVVATTNGTGVVAFTTKAYGSTASVSITSGGDILTGGALSASDIGQDVRAQVTRSGGSDVSDASWASGTGTTLRDSLGNTIQLTDAAASGTPGALGAQMTTTKGTLSFQVGAYADQTRELNIASVYSQDLGIGAVALKTIANIDVTTAEGAADAIKVIDQAISDVSSIRSGLGAIQKNVLESSINSLTIAKENIAASESTIRDTDMAAEMVEFTKLQILQQAGVAMLAQANQAPQALLSLLR